MKALILAAGAGTRLRPHTADKPKCLVSLGGRPLLDTQLASLRRAGVDEIVLAGGYRSESLRPYGLKVIENPDWERTNMVQSLLCAREEFGQDLLVAYSDIVYEPRLPRSLLEASGDFAVLVDDAWEDLWRLRFGDPLSDAETLKFGPDGRIAEIGKKPRSLAEIESQYVGLMRFSRRALEQIVSLCRPGAVLGGRPVEKAFMTDLLQALADSGERLQPVRARGGWVEVDTVEDLARYEALLASGGLSRFVDLGAGARP